MPISVTVRRLGYRLAFRVLQVRWVLTRPRVRGVKCVIRAGDRVLLVRHTYGARAWDLPGGAARRDEPPVDVARREMAEELGLGDADWRELGVLRGRMYRRRDTISIFGASVAESRELTVDPVEILVAAWFDRDRLPLWTSRLLPAVLDNVWPLADDESPRPDTESPPPDDALGAG